MLRIARLGKILAVLFPLSLTGQLAPAIAAQNPFAGVSGTQLLLIVAPDAFMTALQPLVQHKNQTGMSATAIPLSALSPFFQGVDDAETVKNAIRYAHEQLGTKYIMLVGDAHEFPVRYQFMHDLGRYYPYTSQLQDMSWSVPSSWPNAVPNNLSPTGYSAPAQPSGPPAMNADAGIFDGTYIPSDLYYANLYHHPLPYNGTTGAFDNWDANGNGEYNEGTWLDPTKPNPDNVDGIPDVAVGRLPAHTASDVSAYVSKIISYESFQRNIKFTFVADYFYGSAPTLPNQFSSSTAMTQNIIQGSGFANNPANATATLALIEVPATPPGNNVPPNWLNASPSDVANYAAASSWVSYLGHGGNQVWGYNSVFTTTNVAQTSPNSVLPVVFAIGCETGSFINEPPLYNEYADTGGVLHNFQAGPAPTPGNSNVAIITDVDTGQLWGGTNTNPLPLTTPKPNNYDSVDDRGDQSFAYSWLIGSAPGGAIAYFGETGIAIDAMGAELETDLLQFYLLTPTPVLGDIYLKAEQKYAINHQNDPGAPDYHSITRFYLGWMTFFGDPSLRLPNINNSPPQVASVTPNTGSNQGGTIVTIQGANFGTTTGSTQISFANTPASAINCPNPTQCNATSPQDDNGTTAQTVDVQAVVNGLISAKSVNDHFIYPAGPKCTTSLSCPRQYQSPLLTIECPSAVNFYDASGNKTSSTKISFTTTDSLVYVKACDPATNSCSSFSLDHPMRYCGTPPPPPNELCAECRRNGGRCSTSPPPSNRPICIMQ